MDQQNTDAMEIEKEDRVGKDIDKKSCTSSNGATAAIGDFRTSSTEYCPGNIHAWLPSVGALVCLLAVIFMSFSDVSMAITSQSINTIQYSALYALGMLMICIVCTLVLSIKNAELLKRRYSRLEWSYLLPCTFFNGVGVMLFIAAVKFIPVGDVTSLCRTMPVFTAIFGRVFLKQSLRWIDAPLILISIAGVVLIARPSFIFPQQVTDEDDSLAYLGISFALTTAICFSSIFTLGTKMSESKVNPVIIMTLNTAVLLLMNCVIWCFTRGWDCAGSSIILTAILAGAVTAISQVMVFWSVAREKLVVISVILSSNIVFCNILQVIIMRIIPHWLSCVGVFFILTSCVGMALRRREDPAATQENRQGDEQSV